MCESSCVFGKIKYFIRKRLISSYDGKNCERNVDDCAQQPCLNGGTCHDGVANYHCECPAGKTGLLCHLDDACASDPCNAGAICETDVVTGGYNCSCPKGFVGAECNVDVNECDEGESWHLVIPGIFFKVFRLSKLARLGGFGRQPPG